MTTIIIEASDNITTALNNLCNTTQSHITLAVINKQIIAGAIGPEFYKLYNTGCTADVEDFAIRIPTRVMKTVCSSICEIRIDIDTGIKLLKMKDGGVLMGVTVPLEQDFNLDMIIQTIADGKNSSEPLDISAVSDLRPLVSYADSGLQCTDGLAYVIGSGFTAYRKINSKLSFIMTKDNISEFVKFANAHNNIELFESGIYTVFFCGGHYFGCKQPRSFVESDYSSYTSSKPLYSVPLNLSEFCYVLRAIGIPKGESPKCNFDLEHFVVRMDLGSRGRYAIAIGIKDAEPVSGKNASFKILTESLKRVFSGSSLKFDAITLVVYKSFIAFKIGENDFLFVKE